MFFSFFSWYEAGWAPSRLVPIGVTSFKWWGLQQCMVREEAMDPHVGPWQLDAATTDTDGNNTGKKTRSEP